MPEDKNPCLVSDTAALVMLWASGYYAAQPRIAPYLEKLDLSSGRQLVERYDRICPWYAEVIVNRKHFIKTTIEEMIKNDERPAFIVNLGAGFSPLALELSPLLCDQVRFADIDRNNMSHKRRMYAELLPDRCRFISCIESDITDTSCLTKILKHEPGNPAGMRLIVVMEGLTYYIKKPAMARVITSLAALDSDLTIIFEHLKPCRLVSGERRFIPHEIFSHIRDYIQMDRLALYSEDEIRTIMGHGFSVRYYDMDSMEQRRMGSCRYFPTPGSGWISCAVAERRSMSRIN